MWQGRSFMKLIQGKTNRITSPSQWWDTCFGPRNTNKPNFTWKQARTQEFRLSSMYHSNFGFAQVHAISGKVSCPVFFFVSRPPKGMLAKLLRGRGGCPRPPVLSVEGGHGPPPPSSRSHTSLPKRGEGTDGAYGGHRRLTGTDGVWPR